MKASTMGPYIGCCVIVAFMLGAALEVVPKSGKALLFLVTLVVSMVAMAIHAREVQ